MQNLLANKGRLFVVIALVLTAAIMRFLPHPPNLVPTNAIALFAGAHFANNLIAVIVVILSMIISDCFLGFHSTLPVVYGCLIATTLISYRCLAPKKNKNSTRTSSLIRIPVITFANSLLFFIITNFGVWVLEGLYPLTIAGLASCYVAAIPFFVNTLLGDQLYVIALFGPMGLVEGIGIRRSRKDCVSEIPS